MSRPYFKKSIAELEAEYEANASNVDTCKTLLDELDHRNTQRARRLKIRVAASSKLESIAGAATSEPPPSKVPKVEGENIKVAVDVALSLERHASKTRLGPKPAITNDPQNILRAWTALEVLAPHGYRREVDLVGGRTHMIARLNGQLPWELGEKPPPKKRLYYELILGTINLGPAVEKLLALYADKRPDIPIPTRKSPIASILLDKSGCPLDEENSFAISSFAWGVPVALAGDLKLLADWTRCERRLISAFKEKLIKKDPDGKIVPLKYSDIQAMFAHLVSALQLDGLDTTSPSFAIRRHEYFASRTPPEPGLLNSFFLKDLAQARELAQESALPKALSHYLGVSTSTSKVDLLENNSGLRDLLQPVLTPLGRWPGSGRFPLALLQQAAVNASTEKISETGILSVNGPPGTGKTTLLRDIVSARVVERAAVMSTFSNPATAFTPTKQTLQRLGAKITLHTLDDRLKGFEMVVASSNNKAVENVSAELPALDAIASDAHELRYFKSISDNILDSETWGLISAVLGNSSNRYQFSQNFWKDSENGLSTLLNYICGVPQFAVESQSNGDVINRPREIIIREHPPGNKSDALLHWIEAKTKFDDAVSASKATQQRLQKIHEELKQHTEYVNRIKGYKNALPALREAVEVLSIELPRYENALEEVQSALNSNKKKLERCTQNRPGFFARLFRTKSARRWKSTLRRLNSNIADLILTVENKASILSGHHAKVLQAQEILDELQNKLASDEAACSELRSKVDCRSEEIGAAIPDWNFFARQHEDKQIASLWFNQATSLERDQVFEKAIAVHRAFIECAADPIRQNVSIFVESFGTRSLGQPEKDAMIADLWSTFFLVVPVVSTTFASVTNMFSRLPPETLGWLMVDEAGQALPQAAVGAMMRCKQAVIVGDPLQIEPVVTLPEKLTEEICGFFGVDPLKYNAPDASVQTVADVASPCSARFPIGSGYRDVGAPLLVHRRCDSPMFDISNEIAYSNLMVQAKKPSGKERPLGRSCWFDVVGQPGPDKWCEDEAVKLIELLGQMRASGAEPDLYVVSPFVIVQDNLRNRLLNSKILDGWVKKRPREWVNEHVGTVHTVQGREADTVFFVLGAQMPSQNGARSWAGGKPNLVNVAVTRAKASLYVIGNRQLWKSSGYFSTVDRFLPS